MTKKKVGKRKRTPEKEHERALKRRDHFLRSHPKNTAVVLDEYPSLFSRIKCSGKVVLARAKAVFGSIIAGDLSSLTVAPKDGIHIIKVASDELKKQPPDHPEVLCIRTAAGLIPDIAMDNIFSLWERLQSIKTVVWSEKGGKNRSDTKALHLGIWRGTEPTPFVTRDTRQVCPVAREAVEDLLWAIHLHVAPAVKKVISLYSPNLMEKQRRAYEYVKANVYDPYGQFDLLDFGGVFFTVAVKEGSSEIFHIDFGDHPYSLSFVVPFGNGWAGGEFVAPQTGEVIPVGRGQMLGAMTKRLLHSGTKITEGRRLVLTCFTDHNLICGSESYHAVQSTEPV